jgi:periplasmic nitrate reductase NapD
MLKTPTVLDRRALITGRVLTADPVITPPAGEIASIVVQASPAHLSAVEAGILAFDGCEIHGRDARGKLIVVVDAPNAGRTSIPPASSSTPSRRARRVPISGS